MKKIKNFLILAGVVSVACLSFVACGDPDEDPNPGEITYDHMSPPVKVDNNNVINNLNE